MDKYSKRNANNERVLVPIQAGIQDLLTIPEPAEKPHFKTNVINKNMIMLIQSEGGTTNTAVRSTP